jgi:DNA-binding transcriptional LysR family regulator
VLIAIFVRVIHKADELVFTTRQINVFRAVMSTGSVTSAANRLNLSQPSVSRLLRELEEQFGAALFVRKSKGVIPTPEAQLFLEEIERRYGVLATLEEVAHEISHGRRGILNFGTIPAFSFGVVPRALARLGVVNSDIAVNWRVRSSQQLLDWAMAGHLNLGLGYVEGELTGVRVVLRKAVPYMCLLPVGHRKSKARRAVKLSDLARERIIALVGVTSDVVQARRIGLKHHSPIVAEMSFAAAALAQQCRAVAIVDPFSAEWFASFGAAKVVPVTDIPPYEFALFEPLGARSSILCRELQTILLEEIEKTLKRIGTGSSLEDNRVLGSEASRV